MAQQLVQRLYRVRDAVYEHPCHALISVALVATLIYLAAIPLPRVDGQLVGGDGMQYYMFVRSFWIDGDLDFSDEYQYLMGRDGPFIQATGMTGNQYGIGCGLMWTPFFLCAHVMAAILNQLGVQTPMDGYSFLYQGLTLLGSVVYGSLGMLLSFRLADRLFPRNSALLATLLIWLASNVLYYTIAEPSMSQANSLFAVALFLYYWFRTGPERSTGQWAVSGLLASLILMLRLPDIPLLVIPAVESLFFFNRILSAKDYGRMRNHIVNNLTFLGTLLLGFVPQLITWRIIYGNFLLGGRLYGRDVGSSYFNWLSPQVGQVLFSSRHGLFSWHPVFLLAVVGLVCLYRKNKLMAVSLAAGLIANLYVISAWHIWWQGAAFGGRVFISGSIIFVLGLAALIHWLRERRDTLWIEAAALVLIAWNGLFMIQYRFGFISLSDALTFREMVLDKFTLPFQLIRRLLR